MQYLRPVVGSEQGGVTTGSDRFRMMSGTATVQR